jgi:hypothetical protein
MQRIFCGRDSGFRLNTAQAEMPVIDAFEGSR